MLLSLQAPTLSSDVFSGPFGANVTLDATTHSVDRLAVPYWSWRENVEEMGE